MTESTEVTTTTPIAVTTGAHQRLLAIVGAVGGVIITASIIIIIVVAVYVKRSARELRQVKVDQIRRPISSAQRASAVPGTKRQTAEIRNAPGQTDSERGGQEIPNQGEVQGYYAYIPPSDNQASKEEATDVKTETRIIYAALDFDNETGAAKGSTTPGSNSNNNTVSTQNDAFTPTKCTSLTDTYVEMKPLVVSMPTESPAIQMPLSSPTSCIYSLAKDPNSDGNERSPNLGVNVNPMNTTNEKNVGLSPITNAPAHALL